MKKLLFNCFLFSLPFEICFCFFLIDDPFGILYNDKCIGEASEDIIKTRALLKEKVLPYNSFIFGNSRTNAFTPANWQLFIGKEPVFHYGCPGESILNIRRKIELVLKNSTMKNALVLIDDGILENTDNKHRFYQGPVYNHSPITSNVSFLQYYGNYVSYYFDDYFFAKHIYYSLTSDYLENWMKNSFKNPGSRDHLKINSYRYETLADSLINTNFNTYKKTFHPDYSYYKRKVNQISLEDSSHLAEIRRLFDQHAVNYKIIIPPDFNKLKTKPGVYKTMRLLFGDKLFDFTGVNQITVDSTMNYENLHFTVRAGLIIMDSIYKSLPN